MTPPVEIRRRVFAMQELRVSATGEKRTLLGYAAVYDQLSEDLGGFNEMIRRGAFDESLGKDDIRCLWNHDANVVFGRNLAGTLRLMSDARGLKIECDMPDTQAARDIAQSIGRGDVSQMSFGFRTLEQRWTFRRPPELDFRELMKCQLFDVSPVTFAAYPQTEVGVRSAGQDVDAWKAARAAHEAEIESAHAGRRRRLRLAEAS